MTYAEKLKDPRWQKKRLEIMQRDDFTCRDCGDTTKTLNVDHRFYRKGYDPWEYDDADLWTLCEDCHSLISKLRQQLIERIGRLGSCELEQAIRLLKDIPFFDEVLIVEPEVTFRLPQSSWNRICKFLGLNDEALMEFIDLEITSKRVGEA